MGEANPVKAVVRYEVGVKAIRRHAGLPKFNDDDIVRVGFTSEGNIAKRFGRLTHDILAFHLPEESYRGSGRPSCFPESWSITSVRSLILSRLINSLRPRHELELTPVTYFLTSTACS